MRFNYANYVVKRFGKGGCLNATLNTISIPEDIKTTDFIDYFIPYLQIVGDSREQDNWIEKACVYYGIDYKLAKKDRNGEENLKEGDYTFKVIFGDKVFDYTGKVAYERKGSVSEFYNNCTSDRDRIEREFDRFKEKGYDKVVLMLEFGNCINDLKNMTYKYREKGSGQFHEINTNLTMYSTIMSWKQPNNKRFDIIQSNNHLTLFWQMVQDMFYYFRNELKADSKKADDKKGVKYGV